MTQIEAPGNSSKEIQYPEATRLSQDIIAARDSTGIDTNHTGANSEVPYYALDEETLRREIAAAFENISPPQRPWLEANEIQPETPEKDAIKAELMASAEQPHRLVALSLRKEAQDILDSIKPAKNTWTRAIGSIFRHPVKFSQSIKKGMDADWLVGKGWQAAQLIGSQYDKMLAAATPFVQKVEILDVLPLGRNDKLMTQELDQAENTASPDAITTFEQLKLGQQLTEQLTILHSAGLLKQLSTGELGITDGNQELPAPTMRQVLELVEKNLELVKYKADQGFTRLLIVPAVPLDTIAQAFESSLINHYKKDNLYDVHGQLVKLDKWGQVTHRSKANFMPEDIEAVQDLGEDSYNHQEPLNAESRSKAHDNGAMRGWKVVLVKNMPEMPRSRKDIVQFKDRGEFVTSQLCAPKTYMAALERSSQLRGERGFTLPVWFIYALTEMQREGRLIETEQATLLLGSYLPGEQPLIFRNRRKRLVPFIGWKPNASIESSRGVKTRQFKLILGAAPASMSQEGCGVRSAVELN